jgi:hypothetical protein
MAADRPGLDAPWSLIYLVGEGWRLRSAAEPEQGEEWAWDAHRKPSW